MCGFKRAILILILSFSVKVFSCAEVNLQTKEDSPLKDIPVYDQNGLGACYAYAAAILLDYELKKNGNSDHSLTHPIWLALKYSQSVYDKSLEGGIMKDAINKIRKIGICKKEVIDEALTDVKKENNISHAQFLDIVELAHDIFKKDPKMSVDDIYTTAINKCQAKAYNITNSLQDSIFASFQVEEGLFSQVMPTTYLKGLLAKCKAENIYKPEVPKAKKSCEKCIDEKLDEKMAEVLNAGRPVGIRYCASILRYDDYRGIKDSNKSGWLASSRSEKVKLEKDVENDDGTKTRGCRRHASVVVGSRKNSAGKCQYLLRNSWGSRAYKKFPNCLCESEKGVYEECGYKDGQPNKVGCWVDSEELTPNIYELTHF